MAKLKKNELGMGIRALIGGSAVEEKIQKNEPAVVVRELSSAVATINVEQIEVNPYQPRREFDQAALEELCNSLKVHGLIQPITVRRLAEGQYQLISGERRLRASKLAGMNEVPAYIRIANDQEMLEMALVENIQRQDLNAIEVAITYQRLIDECNLTHDEMSDRVGKQRSTVTNYLRLLKLPPEIQQSLKSSLISMGHAKALLGLDDLALQLMMHRRILEGQLSVRDIEALIRSYSQPKNQKKEEPVHPELRKIQDKLSSYFGLKVSVDRNSVGRGKIVISFQSDQQLNGILDRLED
jgi:ParB family transcriptional regulator, chromosome partitioning protein